MKVNKNFSQLVQNLSIPVESINILSILSRHSEKKGFI